MSNSKPQTTELVRRLFDEKAALLSRHLLGGMLFIGERLESWLYTTINNQLF
jgi:hypothetical protein